MIHTAPHAILVKRDGALGDVFDTTPIVARLAAENPGAAIHVETRYPQVYARSAHAAPKPPGYPDHCYARIIDLNMAYEKRMRRLPAVTAYMQEAFKDDGGAYSKRLVYNFNRIPKLGRKAVVLHPARSWPQRTLPQAFWQALALEMQGRDYTVYTVGTAQDWSLNTPTIIETRLPLEQQVALIDAANVYIGSASGPCTYAHATDTPTVCLMTMSPPWALTYERHGQMGWGFRPLVAPIACSGCMERQPAVCTYHACERGDNLCTTLFDPKAVADAACEMVRLYPKDQEGKAAVRASA